MEWIYFSRTRVPEESTLWACPFVELNGGALKLATGCVASGASWAGLPCRPRLAAACAQPAATW